jgi:hypothetical protein
MIGKWVVKNFGINCQWRSKLFLIGIFHFSHRDVCSARCKLRKDCPTALGQGGAENLRASPFNKDLSSAIIFILIHLSGPLSTYRFLSPLPSSFKARFFVI